MYYNAEVPAQSIIHTLETGMTVYSIVYVEILGRQGLYLYTTCGE